jgi:hypothetical protein
MNYELHPNIIEESRELVSLANKVRVKVNNIKDIHRELFYNIKWLSRRTAHHYNRKRLKESHLMIGDKV